jgi:AraC-like DNA-binding protein
MSRARSGLSRPHFYKLFREQVGLTPNLYLNALRMERAIDRLSGSDRGGGRYRLRSGLFQPGQFFAVLHRQRRRAALGLPRSVRPPPGL